MISMGDEVRRTQCGNNNAYCQDNKTRWFDWTLTTKHDDVHRFLKLLIKRRLLHELYPEGHLVSLNRLLPAGRKIWHGVKLGQPDWSLDSHSVALYAEDPKEHLFLHVMLNAYWEPLEFELPAAGRHGIGLWRRWIDTAWIRPTTSANGKNHPSCRGQNIQHNLARS